MVMMSCRIPVYRSSTRYAASSHRKRRYTPLFKVRKSAIHDIDTKHGHEVNTHVASPANQAFKSCFATQPWIRSVVAILPVVSPFPAGEVNQEALRLNML